MKLQKKHTIGIVGGAIILIIDVIMYLLFLQNIKLFYFIIVIALIVGALPFILTVIFESEREKENNEQFLEFSRNLVENVKAGTPISKGIINLKKKDFGTLTPHIHKLANQIALGISVKTALEVFAKDVRSKVISRAVTLISEAEKAGGEIGNILESVARSVSETEELKKERQSSIYGMVMQGYIIFFVFIAIILLIQFSLMPLTQGLGGSSGGGLGDISGIGGGLGGAGAQMQDMTMPMFFLLITQGLFTGLVIGKLAENSFKSGIKHSFIMMAMAALIYFGAGAFF